MKWLLLTSAMLSLNAALHEELNAVNRYELYSRKAKLEGYSNVAKLFHAVAISEYVQSENHKAALLALGTRPGKTTVTRPRVGTTSENLQSAMTIESNMRLLMNVGGPVQTPAKAADVVSESFGLARDAALEHEQLFWTASRHLTAGRAFDYYVSRISGRIRITTSGGGAPRPRSYTDDYFKIQ